MKIYRAFIFVLFIGSLNHSFAQSTVTLDSTVLTVDTLIGELDVPWEIIWGHDNHIWFTERHGKISRLNPETGERKILLDHRGSVYQRSESGMLGLFLHPDFALKPYVYVAYTYFKSSAIIERISRFLYANDTLTNEEILIDDITGNTNHDGCRFLMLPDKTLLISTGDARRSADAQNPVLLNGKLLRMTLDGDIPSDNPNAQSYVWAWGLRNTQGLTLGPGNQIYASDHGPATDDELNIVVKGRNFGWPNIEGPCNTTNEKAFCADSNVVEPIFWWTPTIAPSDLIYYDHPAIPEFQKTLIMTVLKNKMLVAFRLDATGKKVESTANYLTQKFGRLRDICTDGNGNIYLATNGRDWGNSDPNTHVILRLRNMKFIGIESPDKSSGSNMKLYPNPSSGKFQLEIPEDLGKGSLEVINSMGSVVDQTMVAYNRLEYSNQSLTPGVYLVRYFNKDQSRTLRWICTP